MKLNEQIAYFRKEQGMTQEQLASALGVTNQSVSKWESGQNCPDIQLLPELARLFGVTIDTLMGCAEEVPLADLLLRVRGMMKSMPKERAMETAYRVAALLHEGAATLGYTAAPRWCWDRDYAGEDLTAWGGSLANEPEYGCSGRSGMGIFFSLPQCENMPEDLALERLAQEMRRYTDGHALRVLYALFRHGGRETAGLEELVQVTGLEEDAVRQALQVLGAERCGEGWQLPERMRHIPPLLSLLAMT